MSMPATTEELPPRRALFVDQRGNGLRASWHADLGQVVLSTWHGRECVGTVRLGLGDTARLLAFLATHLARRLSRKS